MTSSEHADSSIKDLDLESSKPGEYSQPTAEIIGSKVFRFRNTNTATDTQKDMQFKKVRVPGETIYHKPTYC